MTTSTSGATVSDVKIDDRLFHMIDVGTPVRGRGSGPLFKYQLLIQHGLKVQRKSVAAQIDFVLSDKRGWTRGNSRFQLAAPDMVDYLCAPLKTEGQVSCCMGRRVVFNILRWRNAVPHWTGSVWTYRQMVVNHEFGHRIGKGHGTCPGPGNRAPVMQQQTYGLQGCRANSWPLESEL